MINTSGKWWKGTGPSDLEAYLAEYTADGYPAERCVLAKCVCGSELFVVDADDTEGAASRTCASCGNQTFIADSGEYWNDAEPERCACPCGNEQMNVGVGFALRESGADIRWLYIGCRCAKCGVLGCYADWKIDYSPSLQLLQQV